MMPKPCPDEEYLIDFLEDRLAAGRRSQVENHLISCAACREQVRVCAQLMDGDSLSDIPAVPPALTRQAEAEVAQLSAPRQMRQPWPDPRRWAARGKAAWEQFRFWGSLDPVPVRGSGIQSAGARIQRKKQFGELTVNIEIEPHQGTRALIRVVPEDKMTTMEPVRVALVRDGRELASMMLSDAALVFEDIDCGIYTLKFIYRGELAGEYTFELAGDMDPQPKH